MIKTDFRILAMGDERKDDRSRGPRIAFWIAMLRGIFVVMLGLVLIFNPEKTRVMLANFMGIFWLTTGILLLGHTSSALGDQTDRALGRKTSIVLDSFDATRWIGVLAQSLSSSEEHEKMEANLKLKNIWSSVTKVVRGENDEKKDD